MKLFSQINSGLFLKIRSRIFEKKQKSVNDKTRERVPRMVAKVVERHEKDGSNSRVDIRSIFFTSFDGSVWKIGVHAGDMSIQKYRFHQYIWYTFEKYAKNDKNTPFFGQFF